MGGATGATAWAWSNKTATGAAATINIAAAGYNTVNVWMDEDGVEIDKIVITTNAAYVPTGDGPPEVVREAP
jgi:hypothetical protein